MTLLANWKDILGGAWSVRLMLLAAAISAFAAFLGLVSAEQLGWNPVWFAAASAIINLLAIPARLVVQSGLARAQSFLEDESGSVSRRTVVSLTGAGLVAVLALAVPEIQRSEGRSLVAYQDIVGVWTICDGETLDVGPGDVATPAECDRKLEARVRAFAARIAPCLPERLPVAMQAAFVSASYNIGVGAFCGSSMARRAAVGDLRGACDALRLWNKARVGAGGNLQPVRGLTLRRERERALCLSGLPG